MKVQAGNLMSDIGELIEEWDTGEEFPLHFLSSIVEEVDASAMLGPGVYALCRSGKVLYVGKAKLLVQRIYTHHNAMDRFRRGKKPLRGTKGIVFNELRIFPCKAIDLDLLEQKLIRKFCPRYNERICPKPGERMTLEQIGFDLTKLGVTLVQATPVFRRRI